MRDDNNWGGAAAIAAVSDLAFPLNVFAACILLEEGSVDYLHYGLFQDASEALPVAQWRSCELLMERLPPAPCRILEVGIGLGTMAAELRRMGYEVYGITPDAAQIEIARSKSDAEMVCARLEDFDSRRAGFDVILFQESSQYIDPLAIFGKAYDLLVDGGQLLILDEVALRRVEYEHEGLHLLPAMLDLAGRFGFEIIEQIDLSAKAAPTLDYLLHAVERHRGQLISDMGCTVEQLDALNASNRAYWEKYANGRFGYALLRFTKAAQPRWRLEYGGPARSGEIQALFRRVFGHEMSDALWQWKYADGRGRSVVAWREGEMVVHYGAIGRRVCFFGEPRNVVQIGDVMVDPSERGVLTKNGGFRQAANTFFDFNVGYGADYLASFGFPNERAMRLGCTLGLYGEIDRMLQLEWPALRRGRDLWSVSRHIGNDANAAAVADALWDRMRADLKEAIVGVRDWNYIKYRYLDHPSNAYDVVLVSTRWGWHPLGLVVLKQEGERCELMDVVGALGDFPRLIHQARRLAGRFGAQRLYGWVAASFVSHFIDAGVQPQDIEVSVASNISRFGPTIEQMEKRWWLVSGDTDFR